MKKEISRKGHIVRSAVLLVVCVVMLFASISCKREVVQTGYVDQNKKVEDLNIKGTVTLTINNETNTEKEAMAPRAVAKAFMDKFPGTKVIVEEASRTTYATRISSGDIGDLFWCDENDANNYQRNHNALMPLDAYIKPLNINTEDVYAGALDCGKINGKLYLVPRKIGEQALIYNVTALEASGIDFDNTIATPWEEFKELCIKLTLDEDQDGVWEQVGASMKIWWGPIWQMFFKGYGGKWLDNEAHVISITDDVNVMTGIHELIDAVQKGWLLPEDLGFSGSAADQFKNIPGGDSNISKVVFKTFGAFTWLTRLATAYDNLEIDFDFCPFPAFPTHTVSTGATGYVVFNRTANPDTAAALALFFITEDGQRAYHSTSGGNVPLLKSLADTDFWMAKGTPWEDKNYKTFVSYTEVTQPGSVVCLCPYAVAEIFDNNNMMTAFGNILSGRTSAEDQFQKMQEKANQTWETVYEG